MASRVIMSRSGLPTRTMSGWCRRKRSTSPPGAGAAWWSVDEFNAEVVTGRGAGRQSGRPWHCRGRVLWASRG